MYVAAAAATRCFRVYEKVPSQWYLVVLVHPLV